jgi:2,3-bisphosphoglycerate-independent phosphoglycerate mutase
MKGVVVIIDGLGDLPIEDLCGKTPLDAARTPVLDRLASGGRFGLIDPIGPGETPSTYSGAGMLLGMIPEQAAGLGRGPVEAAGLGLDLAPGDIALRANFATLANGENGLMVVDRRAGRITDGVEQLAGALDEADLGDGIRATFKSTHQHRAVLVLSGTGLDAAISDTDPGDDQLPSALQSAVPGRAQARRTADALNRFVRLAHQRLEDHEINRRRTAAGLAPANGVITRGAGAVVVLDNAICRAGLSACVITGCNTVEGLGKLFGFGSVSDPRFTGDLNTDLAAKFESALAQLENYNIAFVHIKAPDICAHDRNPFAKRDFLEKIDAAMAPLVKQQVVIAVAADHTTDSNTGLHTDDPVPALLSCPAKRGDANSVKFGERACRGGNLPRQASQQFLLEFIQCLQ